MSPSVVLEKRPASVIFGASYVMRTPNASVERPLDAAAFKLAEESSLLCTLFGSITEHRERAAIGSDT